jgi:hypothetical protein
MADIRAAQSGDFSATSTWVGGVVPGSGDVAFANTFTVTISDTRTVQAISNAVGTSITVGGTFSLLNGCNLTCTNANGVVQGVTATSCITTPSLGLGSSASVAASINLTAATTTPAISFSSSGTLLTVGSLAYTGSSAGGAVVISSGTGTLRHTGNIVGSTAGSNSYGMNVTGGSTIEITGNLTGGSAPTVSAALNIGVAGAVATINGNVTGGTVSPGIINSVAATLTVNGICQSSSTAPAIGAGAATQITRLSGPFLLGASGNINPVQAQSWRWAPTLVPTYMQVAQSNGSTLRLLYSADNMPSGGYPTVGNVRQSTVYGPSSEFTGTLSVPAASSVALGVATDNTTGTAILTAANVRAAVGMASANLDTQLAGVSAPSAATVATAVRTELATELGRIDVATSTRLAAASYSAAPTTAAIRTELSTELARLDVAVSTRLSPAGTLATVTTLTNAPSVPSAATIASQVRTELTTELGRIDAAISTRLAPAGTLARVTLTDTTTTLTNASSSAPSAATVASAVRTELTPELARVANCSTVDTTATAIQDAVGA